MPLLSDLCVTVCAVCTHTGIFNLQRVWPVKSKVDSQSCYISCLCSIS